MHINDSLPTSIENGARRALQWDVEKVITDGGNEVRNSRWSTPLRSWTIGYNNAPLTDADHAAVEQMWMDTEGGTHTFNFYDERSDETVVVRFDGDLEYSHTAGPFHRIEVFTLVEVRG